MSDLLVTSNQILERMVDMGDGSYARRVASASINTIAAASTPLTGTTNDTTAHTYGPFTPQLARDIWMTLVGNGASGTAQLLRSTDSGATKLNLTAGASGAGSSDYIGVVNFSGVTGAIINESIVPETDAAATYYLAVTLTAGSITYRVAQ